MRRFLMALGLAVCSAPGASAEGLDFEIIRHEVYGEGWAQLFDGGPADMDGVSGSNPAVFTMAFSAYDFTGLGSGNSSIAVGASSGFGSIGGDPGWLNIITTINADYIGDGPIRPGGAVKGELSSIIEFVMPVERVQWGFLLDLDESTGFTESSMVTVENVTTGEILVSTTEDLIFLTEYAAHTGDVIRVTSAYSVEGIAPANAFGLWYSGAYLGMSIIISETASLGLITFGMALWVLAYKRGPR